MKNAKSVRLKRNALDVQTPKDLPWVLLGAMLHGCADYDLGDNYTNFVGAVRARDKDKLYTSIDCWGPQSISFNEGMTPEQFRIKYQLSAFLKKYPFSGDEAGRRATALTGFIEAEASCADFNHNKSKLLRAFDPGETLMEALPLIKSFIRRVIGDNVSVEAVMADARHGPGASLDTCGGKVTQYFKYADLPYSVTKDAAAYARLLIDSDERWYGALQDRYRRESGIPFTFPISDDQLYDWAFEFVPGNRITFVPKDGRKDRPIAIEPRMNLMLQLGVDGFIRKRLKRFGCNLDSQSKNQFLAQLGSSADGCGKFSTIDLSAASDSVSLELCRLVLPAEWFALLMDLRSPVGVVNASEPFSVVYEKISSMGNGFTFALESLIFLAVAYAAVRMSQDHPVSMDELSVFGDDIVVPTNSALLTIELLDHLGFSINIEKTFVTGPFRESCGHDYYRGHFVRPLFLTSEVLDVKALFSITNRLAFTSYSVFGIESHPLLQRAIDLCRGWIPGRWKTFQGPPSCTEFDTYLHTPFSERDRKRHPYYKYQYRFKRLITMPIDYSKQGSEFLFRKLMVSLKETQPSTVAWTSDAFLARLYGYSTPGTTWHKKAWDPTVTGGSRFTVTERNALTVAQVDSTSSIWMEDYSGDCSLA